MNYFLIIKRFSKVRISLFTILLGHLFSPYILSSQPRKKLVEVVVTPVNDNWKYREGEQVDFEVKVIKNGQALKNITLEYRIGLEQFPPSIEEKIELEEGTTLLSGIALHEPGFVRCHASVDYGGKRYTGWGTAGVNPENIEATVKMPQDFNEFWEQAKKELAGFDIDAKVTLQPDLCTSKYNVYHVSLQNIQMPSSWRGPSRFYGMLSVPKKSGKYPAILEVPGAGVRGYGGDSRAADGFIVFNVGIHGIPVNMPNENYRALDIGSLSEYWNYNLDVRDRYYYKRVYLGCVRAVDFLFSLPEFDGENLGVTGGSQGGALSIVLAGLDDRVKCLAAFYPAMSDMTGYLYGRAGGWPHMYKNSTIEQHPEWVNTTAYYDVVNFAKNIKVPGWYSWGYNDNICPPTSMYAAYNSLNANKELHLFLETQHWTYPEQISDRNIWMSKQLKSIEP